MLRVFFSTDFKGHYPVGTALIVVGKNESEAIKQAKEICSEYRLEFDGTLIEVDVCKPHSIMLCDGDY